MSDFFGATIKNLEEYDLVGENLLDSIKMIELSLALEEDLGHEFSDKFMLCVDWRSVRSIVNSVVDDMC